jgi:hypothetical protein
MQVCPGNRLRGTYTPALRAQSGTAKMEWPRNRLCANIFDKGILCQFTTEKSKRYGTGQHPAAGPPPDQLPRKLLKRSFFNAAGYDTIRLVQTARKVRRFSRPLEGY